MIKQIVIYLYVALPLARCGPGANLLLAGMHNKYTYVYIIYIISIYQNGVNPTHQLWIRIKHMELVITKRVDPRLDDDMFTLKRHLPTPGQRINPDPCPMPH